MARRPKPKMPFGKHKGVPFACLPDDYLCWLASIDLQPWLRMCVEGQIQKRGLIVPEREEEELLPVCVLLSRKIVFMD